MTARDLVAPEPVRPHAAPHVGDLVRAYREELPRATRKPGAPLPGATGLPAAGRANGVTVPAAGLSLEALINRGGAP